MTRRTLLQLIPSSIAGLILGKSAKAAKPADVAKPVEGQTIHVKEFPHGATYHNCTFIIPEGSTIDMHNGTVMYSMFQSARSDVPLRPRKIKLS